MKTITEINYGYMPRGPCGKQQQCEQCGKAPARFIVTNVRWWFYKQTQFVCDRCVKWEPVK